LKFNDFCSEKKIEKTKLDKAQDCLNEKCLEKNKLQADIKKIKEETRIFINTCQESYDNEIANVSYIDNFYRNIYNLITHIKLYFKVYTKLYFKVYADYILYIIKLYFKL